MFSNIVSICWVSKKIHENVKIKKQRKNRTKSEILNLFLQLKKTKSSLQKAFKIYKDYQQKNGYCSHQKYLLLVILFPFPTFWTKSHFLILLFCLISICQVATMFSHEINKQIVNKTILKHLLRFAAAFITLND